MNAFISPVAFGLTFLVCISCGGSDPLPETNDITNLNTLQIIRKFGYPAESHTVKTADGYLLEMHRIRHGRHSNQKTAKKPPVFMHHGLLGSSSDFFLNGTEFALPFLLSDLGFDVWLGNARGNVYSRAHINLSPKDLKFWNFTWHETAIYDVPAQIDFICDHTKQEKIIFIGFSMGTTVFFVMTSTLPEYNDKIEVSFLMAAIGYLKNVRSPLLRFLAPFSESLNIIIKLITAGEFLSESSLLTYLARIACEESLAERKLCMNAIFLLVGRDPKEFDLNSFPTLLSHFPQGYSSKAVNHYSQLLKSGKFRQYDYGAIGNEKEYGSSYPPEYDLSAIETPMYIYEGKNDYLSDLKDVEHLSKQLNTLRKVHVVDYPLFTHLDFLVSFDIKRLIYDVLIKDLMSYLNDDNDVDSVEDISKLDLSEW